MVRGSANELLLYLDPGFDSKSQQIFYYSSKYLNIYIIKVTVCVRACVFSIGGHTVGPTELKFGMEDHIYPREVIGYILFPNTYPPGGGRPKSGSGDPCSPNGAFL